MKLNELTKTLDDFFEIDKFKKDMPFSLAIPEIYSKKGINIEKYFTKSFLKNFHGLMIENSRLVKKIYGTVFLDRRVLDKILRRDEKDILIFSHHPMEDETSGEGFIPLDKNYLKKLKELNVSVYVLHTPLEMNKKISVTGSIINQLGLINVKLYPNQDYEFDIPIGELPKPLKFENFIKFVKKIMDNQKINYIKKRDFVRRIAVLSGGGTDFNFIKKAIQLNCDTYLTGEYYNKLKIPLGAEERKRFDEESTKIDINLVEGSHYSSEKVVFLNEIPLLFKKLGISYEFIEQENPWY